ncbi:MAG: hypothetical protein GF393_08870 [Armatimonadia bacterium]|nr:hypothetical protein [Armatimonadia bacterium]
MSRPHLLAVIALLAALATSAHAQTRLAVNITDVTVKQLTNGLRITLKADGLLEVDSTGQWWETNAEHEFPLWLGNARSAVGTFVDISRYPVNYLKLETPQDAREGVGLTLTVKLYRSAHVRSVELDNEDFDWTWDWDPGEVAYDLRKSRSGKELVITVWSDRREILPGDRKPRYKQDLPHELSLEVTDGHVSVDALNVPLDQLMEQVAERTGRSVYVNDRVERLATLRLQDIAVERFVEVVAASLGLTSHFEDNAWYISDGLPSSLAPYTAGDSRTIRLNYMEADAAIAMLPEFLLRFLRPSPTGDAIVAHGPTRLLDRIEADVTLLDKPRRAVRIHTTMVQASTARGRQLMWSILRGGSTTIDLDGAEGEIRITHGDEPQEDLVAQLRALAEREKISVTVRPSLLVEEGQHAYLFSGVKQFFQFLRYGERLDLDSTEAGVGLYVRPYAIGERLVRSFVQLEVSTIRGNRQPPVVDTREAWSTLLLGSGESMIVSGGLLDRSHFSERGGPAPLAPEIPGVDTSGDQTREIVFLVGAEVVNGRVASAEDELAQRREN